MYEGPVIEIKALGVMALAAGYGRGSSIYQGLEILFLLRSR